MAEYLESVKSLCDQLDSMGYPVTEEERIYAVLNGLGTDYESISTVIENSMETFPEPSYDSVVSRLTNFDDKKRHNTRSSEITPHLAFSTGRGYDFTNRGRGQFYGRFGSHQQDRVSSYRGRGNYSTRGRGFPQQFNSKPERGGSSEQTSRPICQICGKYGHLAFKCYRRYDPPHAEDEHHTALAAFRIDDYSENAGHEWYPDTGATAHITHSTAHMNDLQEYHGSDSVMVGNGEFLPITHVGSIPLSTNKGTIVLDEVLVCPSITKSLLSVSKLTAAYPIAFEFDSKGVYVKEKDTNQVITQGKRIKGLYVLENQQLAAYFSNRQQCVSEDVWHMRLGHPNREILQQLSKNQSIVVKKSNVLSLCNGCQMGKNCRLPFVSSEFVATRILERIHCDLWGPSPISSTQGFRYYVIFVDSKSRYTWFYPLKRKSDFLATFVKFQCLVETQFQQHIAIFQSDGGGEFLNKEFLRVLESKGIKHLVSCPHTPQQNGLVERKHRHIVELGMAMMFHGRIPQVLWVEALFTASFLINLLPSSTLPKDDTPYKVLLGTSPNYTSLRVFGCLCYPYLRPYSQNKFDPKSLPCVFLGYNERYKGYRCYHPPTSRIYICRHVIFEETEFPFKNLYSRFHPEATTPLMAAWEKMFSSISEVSGDVVPPAEEVPNIVIQSSQAAVPTQNTQPQLQVIEELSPLREPDATMLPVSHSPQHQPRTGTDPYIINTITDEVLSIHVQDVPSSTEATHPMITRAKSGISKPNPRYILLAVKSEHPEPKTVKSALKDPGWSKAMQEEMDTLHETSTWELVEKPMDVIPVGCKWIFKTKIQADGTLDKLKARLVAKGYEQEEGIDYMETFSPVVRTATVRIVLHVATTRKWSIKQLDVKNAFLHGDLQETVYMWQPPGFIDSSKPEHVCRLKKSIYGLKQAPRAWYDKFSIYLLNFGFTCSMADPSLFVYNRHGEVMYLLLYVDDMILTGSSDNLLARLLQGLNSEFRMKDLGALTYFLGIQAQFTKDGLFLNQSKYASDLLYIAGMAECTSMPTPLPMHFDTVNGQQKPFEDPSYFRSLAGKLQYLTLTRPDLQFAVNLVCQRMHTPSVSDYTLLKRILRYIQGTKDMGVTILTYTDTTLRAYCDSDWAGCKETRRSTGGFCTYLGCNLVSWSAKRQPTVSKSSTEAEYRTLSTTASEITWLTSLLKELGISQSQPAELYCDNLSAVHLSANPVMHGRSKHFDVDYHYVRERVALGALVVKHIPSHQQIADIFTKPLSHQPFFDLRFNLGVDVPPTPSLRGCNSTNKSLQGKAEDKSSASHCTRNRTTNIHNRFNILAQEEDDV